eukprot:TRINITY_DN24083_c0_g2_i1.p1 TRINITY_DN24083_c0_g2~~TRINITY_DN24083_c0_g2_i1.p1  ORF type:complete len:350 (-),score=42.59 TRINITY_DN24083_c0_g2_i1:141-1190(-)
MAQSNAALRGLVTQDNGNRKSSFSPRAVVPKAESRKTPPSTRTASPSIASRLLCCFHGNVKTIREPEEDAGISEMRADDAPAVSQPSAPSVLPIVRAPQEECSSVPNVPSSSGLNQPHERPMHHDVSDASCGNQAAKSTPEPKPKATKATPRRKDYILPPQRTDFRDRKTLVLDLDETLVHSSFTPVSCEIILNLQLGNETHQVYVKKRPGVDEFLENVAKWYEVVIFTASTALYANTLLDELDIHGSIQYRLFRDACTKYKEGYVKDLSRLGRNLEQVIIIDNLPICYALQPENAIPIITWRDDPDDTELLDLLPILVALAGVDHIPRVLREILYDDAEPEEGDGERQ